MLPLIVLRLETPAIDVSAPAVYKNPVRVGPKGVSTKGVSMNRPLLPIFRAFLTAISKRNCQKSP